ncbi:hypothetical protein Scep_019999 [Stephania cephalantha]|uniref:Uncharacterized protein n=1 Tax=Stephania cephalantha TaxID=152367 RepID=A0AAP0NNU7_9MAGN
MFTWVRHLDFTHFGLVHRICWVAECEIFRQARARGKERISKVLERKIGEEDKETPFHVFEVFGDRMHVDVPNRGNGILATTSIVRHRRPTNLAKEREGPSVARLGTTTDGNLVTRIIDNLILSASSSRQSISGEMADASLSWQSSGLEADICIIKQSVECVEAHEGDKIFGFYEPI